MSVSLDKTIKLWDIAFPEHPKQTIGLQDRVTSATLSSDGLMIASARRGGEIIIWNAEDGTQITTLRSHAGNIGCVRFDQNNQLLAEGTVDGTIIIWNVVQWSEIARFSISSIASMRGVTSLAFIRDSRQLIVGCEDRLVRVWDLVSKQIVRTFAGHSDRVTGVAIASKTGRIVSCAEDETIKLWDASVEDVIPPWTPHLGSVNSTGCTNDGTRFASASADKSIKICNAETGEELRVIAGHTQIVTSVAFSLDGQRIASTSHDRSLRLWNVTTEEPLTTFFSDSSLYCCAWSPDGTMIAAGVRSGNVIFLLVAE